MDKEFLSLYNTDGEDFENHPVSSLYTYDTDAKKEINGDIWRQTLYINYTPYSKKKEIYSSNLSLRVLKLLCFRPELEDFTDDEGNVLRSARVFKQIR